MNYLVGIGNHFESEAVPGALPKEQNSPRKVPFDLFAEQLSGTAFTAPRSENLRSWLYRIQPSVTQGTFRPLDGATANETRATPTQLRWDPTPYPNGPVDFLRSLNLIAENTDSSFRKGCTVSTYTATAPMESYFYSADGEFLIVPQEGALLLATEMGDLEVHPEEIAVIPRGIRLQVQLPAKKARGYVCENHGAPLRLPGLGPIGANGLANPRDFLVPSAKFEEKRGSLEIIAKFQGRYWSAPIDHSPLNVVAWHGNYYPFKYDLRKFNTINTVTYDHPDPSIFTVLTSPSEVIGTANLDFVIFPPRWMVAEHTFRPPYYHRNVMSEFMGLIRGAYDAKGTGFVPGGGSLHNCMSPHGPDAETYYAAVKSDDNPQRYENTMAFMFESCTPFRVSRNAEESAQKNYLDCWKGLKADFKRP